jgi:hypothetical protein
MLRALADRIDHGPPEMEETIARALEERLLEDRLDGEAVRVARQEKGRVTLEELKARLGL